MNKFSTLLLLLASASLAMAEVTLPGIFQDHMILQQGVEASVWGWADPGEDVTVAFAGQTKKATPDATGRWQVRLDPLKVSSEGRELRVTGKTTVVVKDVLVGEVWLAAGQSNMASGLKQVPGDEKAVFSEQKTNNRVRAFIGDHWFLCSEQALQTSAVGFFFALKLEQELDVPVAYIVVARLGSRIEPFIPEEDYKTTGLQQKSSGIYTSAIAPLTSYALKGVIWYQGESNRGSTDYYTCIKALHTGWSRAFQIPDMPFYQVQIAPFDYSRKGQISSLLGDTVWAAQYRAAKEIPGVEVVAIHDTDIHVKMIHPRRKKPVGERLAALALKHPYGRDVITSGPVFSRATRAGNKVLVYFDGIDKGLGTKQDGPPNCFELSEDGESFVQARASLKGDHVEVVAENLTTPKFVRMGWFDTATPTLQDQNGWPAFAFPAQDIHPADLPKEKASAPMDAKTLKQWSAPYRGWHYHPDHVIPAKPEIKGFELVHKTDVPTVFQIPGDRKWYMTFIGFDGKGYQSFIAESDDLVQWTNMRLAMGYGPEGSFDYGGVVLGAFLYEDYDIKAPRTLKKKNGKYVSLYGAYPRQGGYELRPGYEGVAFSDDGFSWHRAQDEPILSIYQKDCGTWEKDCIYQPWLLEHLGTYYNFYNAANGGTEQMGLALSDDLLGWSRYAHNPVITHGPKDSYNQTFSSDGKVFWDQDHWVNFFFGVGRGGAHIMVAFSRDLYHWTVDPEPIYKSGGNPSGLDKQYAHKISLVWNPANETYYLFYNAVGSKGRGIGLITSKNTFSPPVHRLR